MATSSRAIPDRPLLYLVAILILSGLASSCGGRSRVSTERCPPGETCEDDGTVVGTSCSGDGDCQPGEVCEAGICTEAPGDGTGPCASNADCPVSMFCDLASATCVDCLTDDHCDAGLTCQSDGSCGDDAACVSDADCDGLICDPATSTCVQCTTDSQCAGGLVCRENTCVPDTSQGIPCTSQLDCDPYGRVCDLASGLCVPCTSDSQCAAGQICQTGLCIPDNTSGTGDCTSYNDCGGLACIAGVCGPCTADTDCWDIADMLLGETRICESDYCVPPQCRTANDCAPPLGCWTGRCGPCNTDSECRTGEVCETASGNCITAPEPECSTNRDCTGGLVCLSGQCANCTNSTQCDAGMVCSAGVCIQDNTPVGPTLGEACTSETECNTGETCITIDTSMFCSRSCIGSGAGNDADCPQGFACYNWDQGVFDGVSMCVPAGIMPTTTDDGQPFPGQPFDILPGGTCSPTNNGCQTLYCFDDSRCMRSCLSNRDCASFESCYAAWVEDTTAASGYGLIDVHYCAVSDTANFKSAGEACAAGYECDSGLCTGLCSDDQTQPCNSGSDCTSGVCSGLCRDHCRSNADCPQGLTCDGWPVYLANQTGWVPTCQPQLGTGTLQNGASCTTNESCESDWCINDICTTMCGLDSDCSGISAAPRCSLVSMLGSDEQPVYMAQFCSPIRN